MDSHNNLKYSSLQGESVNQYNIDQSIDSVVLVDHKGRVYYKSRAIIKIMESMGSFYVLAIIFRLVPRAILDKFYDYMASNRYNWFGKKDSCRLIQPHEKDKFME